jgi:hypothetical protein
MLKFVIERQYLVPMYQHIVVEAENLEEACKKGISDDYRLGHPGNRLRWRSQGHANLRQGDPGQAGRDPGILWDRSEHPDRPLAIAPVTFLYNGEHGPLAEIPAIFTKDE